MGARLCGAGGHRFQGGGVAERALPKGVAARRPWSTWSTCVDFLDTKFLRLKRGTSSRMIRSRGPTLHLRCPCCGRRSGTRYCAIMGCARVRGSPREPGRDAGVGGEGGGGGTRLSCERNDLVDGEGEHFCKLDTAFYLTVLRGERGCDERARGELLHGVFNVVWLPGVARLHGGRGWHTLTANSAMCRCVELGSR